MAMQVLNYYEGVGKTCLASRFRYGHYEEYGNTLYIEYTEKTVEINGLKIRLSIWDSTGEINFKNSVQQQFQGKVAGFVVFDITSLSSFVSAEGWIKRLKELANPEAEIFLIGSKCDLEEKRQVEKERAEIMADEQNISYFEVSALTGINVQTIFTQIGARVLKKIEEKVINIDHGQTGIRKKGYNLKSTAIRRSNVTNPQPANNNICSQIGNFFSSIFSTKKT